MRREKNNPKLDTTVKFDADQIKFLQETFKADKSFSPKSVAEELGLDPNNPKHVMKIKNWKENMVRKAKKEKEGEPQPGSSKDEPKPGGASKD